MGGLEKKYDEEYPALNSYPAVEPIAETEPATEQPYVEHFERKILNIPKRSMPENFDEFYQTLTKEMKKYGANIIFSKMPSGSYNLSVRCPANHMKNVVGVIRYLVEGKITRMIQVEPVVLSKIHENDKEFLQHILAKFNGRVAYNLDGDFLHLSGVGTDVDEAFRLVTEQVEAMKSYDERVITDIHPKYFNLIKGPFESDLKKLLKDCLRPVTIAFPSSDSLENEIKISGYIDDVALVYSYIRNKYLTLMDYQETTIPLAQQYRDNITRVSGIDKILKETGVSVYISPNKADKKIYLIGDEDRLADAVPVVLDRAKNYAVKEISCLKSLYNVLKEFPEFDFTNLKATYKELWSSYVASKELIMLDGPVSIVDKVAEKFNQKIDDLKEKFSFRIIQYPSTFLYFLKSHGAEEIGKLVAEHDAIVDLGDVVNQGRVFPFNSNLQMHLTGNSSSISRAFSIVSEYIADLKQNESLDVEFESFYSPHLQDICKNRSIVDEVKSRFGNSVKVSLRAPKQRRQHIISLVGMKGSVMSAELYIDELFERVKQYFSVKDISIPKAYHYLIIGRGGSTRNKIIDESGVERLVVPSADYSGPDSNIVTIFGDASCVEVAEQMILDICNIDIELDEMEIELPKNLITQLKMLNSLVARRVVQNCTKAGKDIPGANDVVLLFPPDGSVTTKVKVRGTKKLVEIVVTELQKLAKGGFFTEQLAVEDSYFKSIIGRNGANLQRLTSDTRADLIIPSINKRQTSPEDKIVIIGYTKNEVQKLKEKLLKFLQELKDITEVKVKIPNKFAKKLTFRNGDEESLLVQYRTQYPSVKVIFPKEEPNEDYALRGPSAYVEKLRKEIVNQVNFWEKMVSESLVITQEHLSCMRQQDKNIITTLSEKHNVVIKIRKDRGVTVEDLDVLSNRHQVVIEGLPNNVNTVKKFIEDLKPVQSSLTVPKKFHSVIIGSKGTGLKRLLDGLNVALNFPPNDVMSEVIELSGPASHLATFKKRLEPVLSEAMKRQSEWEQKNQIVELEVDPKWYSKLIGKGGTFISSLKKKFDVSILIPGTNNNSSVVILDHKFVTIRGEMRNIRMAKERIEDLVNDWEHTVEEIIHVPKELHGRLRGFKSANIRNIQKKHNVEIRFASQEAFDDDTITLRGKSANINSAIREINDIVAKYTVNQADMEDEDEMKSRSTIETFKFGKRSPGNNREPTQGKVENYNQGLKTLQEIYGAENKKSQNPGEKLDESYEVNENI